MKRGRSPSPELSRWAGSQEPPRGAPVALPRGGTDRDRPPPDARWDPRERERDYRPRYDERPRPDDRARSVIDDSRPRADDRGRRGGEAPRGAWEREGGGADGPRSGTWERERGGRDRERDTRGDDRDRGALVGSAANSADFRGGRPDDREGSAANSADFRSGGSRLEDRERERGAPGGSAASSADFRGGGRPDDRDRRFNTVAVERAIRDTKSPAIAAAEQPSSSSSYSRSNTGTGVGTVAVGSRGNDRQPTTLDSNRLSSSNNSSSGPASGSSRGNGSSGLSSSSPPPLPPPATSQPRGSTVIDSDSDDYDGSPAPDEEAKLLEASKRRREAILAKHRAASAAAATTAATDAMTAPPGGPAASVPESRSTLPQVASTATDNLGSSLAPISNGSHAAPFTTTTSSGRALIPSDNETAAPAATRSSSSSSSGAGANFNFSSSSSGGGGSAVLTSTDQLAVPSLALLGGRGGVVARPAPSMFDDDDDEEGDEEDRARLRELQQQQQGQNGYVAAGAADTRTNAAAVSAAASALMDTSIENPALLDNWDDAEGYYKIRIGEVMDERYQVLGVRGRGVFSTVLYCRDLKAVETRATEINDDETVAAAAEGTITTTAAPTAIGSTGARMTRHAALATGSSSFVAIKVIRANDTMRRAGMKEVDYLRSLATADPHGRYHCVRLLATFDHRAHLCLVFETLHMNLKEVQNKFGKGVGIAISAVHSYAKQMLLSLALLAKLGLIHADIKPHNILANERYNVIKLADFGSAFRESDPDNEPTPYLVSRFYRAPEIILGAKHTPALDMWSIACCLFELYTGHPLFPGDDNNDMLWRFQCLRGRFPNRLTKAHLRACETLGIPSHFDADLKFRRNVLDPVSRAPIVKHIEILAPTEDLGALLMAKRAADDDKRVVMHLKDLLEKMLTLDPARRLTVKEAMAHPFIKGHVT